MAISIYIVSSCILLMVLNTKMFATAVSLLKLTNYLWSFQSYIGNEPRLVSSTREAAETVDEFHYATDNVVGD